MSEQVASYPGHSVLPGVGGARIAVMTLPPSEQDWETTLADLQRPGAAIAGLHATNTVDIGVVLSGRVAVVGTDGVAEVLEPGDLHVQYGAPHAWRNAGTEPATLAAVMLGVAR